MRVGIGSFLKRSEGRERCLACVGEGAEGGERTLPRDKPGVTCWRGSNAVPPPTPPWSSSRLAKAIDLYFLPTAEPYRALRFVFTSARRRRRDRGDKDDCPRWHEASIGQMTGRKRKSPSHR